MSDLPPSEGGRGEWVKAATDALRQAEQFIENGVELGFIRLPSAGDPALDTLPAIKAALASAPVSPMGSGGGSSRADTDRLCGAASEASTLVPGEVGRPLTEDQIKHMAGRFLGWKLPANFNPDAGISFKPEFNVEYMASRGKPPMRHEPIGTNLFDYDQAVEMVRHLVEDLPS